MLNVYIYTPPPLPHPMPPPRPSSQPQTPPQQRWPVAVWARPPGPADGPRPYGGLQSGSQTDDDRMAHESMSRISCKLQGTLFLEVSGGVLQTG